MNYCYDNINNKYKITNEDIDIHIHTLIKCADFSERVYNINESTEKIEFVDNKETDVECIISKNEFDSICYIVFRGSTSLMDWKHDLNILKVSPSFLKQNSPKCKVHKGFDEGYMSIRNKLVNLYDKQYKRYIFSGHSYGASLCSLAALDCSLNFCNTVDCITFGSPRIGDRRFVKLFNKKINNCYRCVFKNDPITVTPSYIRFKHVKGHIKLSDNPKYVNVKKNQMWFWNLFLFQINDHDIKNYRKSLVCYLKDINSV